MPESNPQVTENRRWTREILKEYRNYENPPLSADIDIVWILSGPGTYSMNSAAFPNIYSAPTEGTSSQFEDKERVDFGADLVKKITALRTGKKEEEITREDIAGYGPSLLYNGTNFQNQDLEKTSNLADFPIPKKKIIIAPVSEEDNPVLINTRTQFENFPQDRLEPLVTSGRRIAVVTHLYHLSRVTRTVSAPRVLKKQPLWQDVDILFFAADRPKDQLPEDAQSVTKRAAEIRRRVKSEGSRIAAYTKTERLSKNPKKEGNQKN